jgi:hypothetical protein
MGMMMLMMNDDASNHIFLPLFFPNLLQSLLLYLQTCTPYLRVPGKAALAFFFPLMAI